MNQVSNKSPERSSIAWLSWLDRLRAWFSDTRNTIIFVIAFLLFWEFAVVTFKIPRYILPSLSSIVRQFIRNFQLIWEYTLVTGWETLVGFVIAVSIGVPLLALPYAIPPLTRYG